MKIKLLKTTAITCGVLLALSSGLSSAQARELRLGHGMPEDNAQNIGLMAFADEVKKLSNGDLTVTIYPNSQLRTERELAEQVVTGALDMCKISGSLSETFEPKYSVMSLPYLFRGYDHAKKFIQSDLPEKYLFQASEGRGLIGVMLIGAGTRNFYATKPIAKPEDLDGLKMRVPESELAMTMVKALGGQPTPIPWSEIYSALQQKVVDGAENSISAYVEQRHCEVDKYYSLDEHTMTPDVVFMSDLTWETLTDEEKDIVKKAAKKGIEVELATWDKNDAINMQKAKDMGTVFVQADKEAFRAKTAFMIEEARKKEGYSELIDAILAL